MDEREKHYTVLNGEEYLKHFRQIVDRIKEQKDNGKITTDDPISPKLWYYKC